MHVLNYQLLYNEAESEIRTSIGSQKERERGDLR